MNLWRLFLKFCFRADVTEVSRFSLFRAFGGSFNNKKGSSWNCSQPRFPRLTSSSSSKIWASSGPDGIVFDYFPERFLVPSSFILSDIVFESHVTMEGEQKRSERWCSKDRKKKSTLSIQACLNTETLSDRVAALRGGWGGGRCSIHNFCLSACW